MNRLKHTLLLAILLLATSSMPASAKNYVVPKAYMFGFIASFNDSIVFFTDVQEVDSVWYQDRKKKILAGRSNYSHQLREFFATNFNLQKRTCVVVCGLKRKDVEKKYQKMVKQQVRRPLHQRLRVQVRHLQHGRLRPAARSGAQEEKGQEAQAQEISHP